jgi:hypothetical protein
MFSSLISLQIRRRFELQFFWFNLLSSSQKNRRHLKKFWILTSFLLKKKNVVEIFCKKWKITNYVESSMIFLFLFRTRRAIFFFLSNASRRCLVMSSLFFFRISKISRRRNVIKTKFNESFINQFVVKKKNDDKFIDENNDEY